MEAFLLKLLVTPALVGVASLAGRRWGAAVSGWLVGIPLTSGPIAFFLALDPGVHFAADASVGILAGTVSQAAFALAYAWTGMRFPWPACLAASTVAFLGATWFLDLFRLDGAPTFLLAVCALVIAMILMPKVRLDREPASPLPWWDIPARMLIATVFVIGLTYAAPLLGARLAGLLAPFPLYAAVLAVFAHRLQSEAAAVAVLRGLLLGLFAFAGFFLSLSTLLVTQGIVVAFAAAIAVALVAQSASLFAGRRWQLA